MEPVTQPAPDAAAIRIADEVFDRLEAKGATAAAFGAAEVGEALREAGAQSDAAAIREAAHVLLTALHKAQIDMKILKLFYNGQLNSGLAALITEKPHDRA